MSGNVLEITDASFQAEVLDSSLPVLVDFWAPWCGPCKALAPTIAAIADDYAGKLKVCKINTDDHSDAASEYNISGLPTCVIFKGGQIVNKIVGMAHRSKFDASLGEVI